jgi:hypothetical protein
VSEIDLEQVREQTIKATRYFRRILEQSQKTIICGRQDDVVIVIARAEEADRVEKAVSEVSLDYVGRPVVFAKIPEEWPPE